jgi:drug/metabolite transporter (DMT)-like permease
MPRSPTAADWLTLLALTLLWGTSFMFNELALASFSPMQLVASRVTIAAILLFGYLIARGGRLPRRLSDWAPLFVMSILGTVLPFHLLAWAQLTIDSSVTGVLTAVVPLFVLTLSHFFVPGIRFTANRLAGFAVGFLGVVIVIGPGAASALSESEPFVAMLAVLAAAVSYSINTVYARRLGASDPAVLAAGMMLMSSLLTMPRAAPELATLAVPPTGLAIVALLVLGLLSTGLATVLYFRLIHGPGPTFLSVVNYLVPVCALLAGALVLGETPSGWVYAGLVLILVGIGLSEIGVGRLRVLAGRAVKKVAAA